MSGAGAGGARRVLVSAYALMAIAATGRSAVQVGTRFHQARVAYALSAAAAVVYAVAAAALARPGPRARVAALATCAVEMAGVLVVGAVSLAAPERFPDETVWSAFGRGYGFVPLLLPALGLAWLWRTRPAPAPA